MPSKSKYTLKGKQNQNDDNVIEHINNDVHESNVQPEQSNEPIEQVHDGDHPEVPFTPAVGKRGRKPRAKKEEDKKEEVKEADVNEETSDGDNINVKLSFAELKDMAKQTKVALSYMVDGKRKKKTKVQLRNELGI